MTGRVLAPLTEDEFDTLVSIAIRRAELLDDVGSPLAIDAWHEVMVYEEQLAEITRADDIAGGVARVGAISAALAAGQSRDAKRLARKYLEEDHFPSERQLAIKRAFDENYERLTRRFPALARSGYLTELDDWRSSASAHPHVFPWAA